MSGPLLSFQFSWKPLWVAKDGSTLPYQSVAQQQAQAAGDPGAGSAPKLSAAPPRCKYPLEATFLVTCENTAPARGQQAEDDGPLLGASSRGASRSPGGATAAGIDFSDVGSSDERESSLGPRDLSAVGTADFFSPMSVPSSVTTSMLTGGSTFFSPGSRQVSTVQGDPTGTVEPGAAAATPSAGTTNEDPYSIIHWSDMAVPAVPPPPLTKGQRQHQVEPPPAQPDETVSCLRIVPPLVPAAWSQPGAKRGKVLAGFGRQGRWGATFRPALPQQAPPPPPPNISPSTAAAVPPTSHPTRSGATLWSGVAEGIGEIKNAGISIDFNPASPANQDSSKAARPASAVVNRERLANKITGNNILQSYLPRHNAMVAPKEDSADMSLSKRPDARSPRESTIDPFIISSNDGSKSPRPGGNFLAPDVGLLTKSQRRRSATATVMATVAMMPKRRGGGREGTVTPIHDAKLSTSQLVPEMSQSQRRKSSLRPNANAPMSKLEPITIANAPKIMECYEDAVPSDVVKASYGQKQHHEGHGVVVSSGVSSGATLEDEIAARVCGSALQHQLAATAEDLHLELDRSVVVKSLKPEVSLCFVTPTEASAGRSKQKPEAKAGARAGTRSTSFSMGGKGAAGTNASPAALDALQHVRGDPLQVFWAQRYGITAVQYGVALAKAIKTAPPNTIPSDLSSSCYVLGDDCGLVLVSASEDLVNLAVSEIPSTQYTFPLGASDHSVCLLKPGDFGAGMDGILRCGTLAYPEKIETILERSIAEARGVATRDGTSSGGSSGVLVRSAAHYRLTQQPGDEPIEPKKKPLPALTEVAAEPGYSSSFPRYGACLHEVVLGQEESTVPAVVARSDLDIMRKNELQLKALNDEFEDERGLSPEEQKIKAALERASTHVDQWVGYDAVYQFPRPPFTHMWTPPTEKSGGGGGAGKSSRGRK